jgi:PAS domain S-box-containing protein
MKWQMEPDTHEQLASLTRRISELEDENRRLQSSLQANAAAAETTTAESAAAAVENAMREEKRTLELLNQTGIALSAELNLDRLVQIVIDAGVQLVGAAFGAFFYNSTNAQGDKYMLYALSGAPREAFSKFPMPGPTQLFAPTFAGESIIRSADIAKDPRYGHNAPYHGMPEGHLPVRSYLSVPVISASKEVLGGLFFGHPQPGIFNERAERLIVGIAAHTAIAVENARLHAAVQNSESRFRALIESSADGIAVIDADNNIQYLSPAVAAIEGYTPAELVGHNGVDNTHPDDLPLLQETVRRTLENPGVPIPIIWRRRHKDGHWLWLEGLGTNLLHDPAVRGIVTNYRDISQRVRAEENQIRSQKMEALGTLAGGIAHDFNNILSAIRGNAKLASEDIAANHPSQHSLAEIHKASGRAADLVQRILSFSRQQDSRRDPVNLQLVVQEALNLMRATLPAMIDIVTHVTSNTPTVMADATQIHQLVMNLVTNASHAIGNASGVVEVTIDTLLVTADLAATARELQPGYYARLTISDTGCGMDHATMRRIFDPFFTTKPVGQGTGLGLSVAHGIMRAHDGAVTVYSQPSKGTTFRLYFPIAADQHPRKAEQIHPIAPGGGERVLYVDDDEALVHLTTRVLERLGYRVSGFSHPHQAIAAFNANPQDFDVVVTDLSMPGMSGFELANKLHARRPDIPILMTSGYVRPEDREAAQQRGIREFILKPNTVDDIGRCLDKTFRELRNKKST